MSTLTYFFAGVNFKELPDKTGGEFYENDGKVEVLYFQ